VRAGTRTLVSASPGMLGAGRAGARARPMSVQGGRSRLVELGGASGAWWRSGGWWLLPEASTQWACALVMPARKREGKVRCELGLTAR
jgi:hypothetical protein